MPFKRGVHVWLEALVRVFEPSSIPHAKKFAKRIKRLPESLASELDPETLVEAQELMEAGELWLVRFDDVAWAWTKDNGDRLVPLVHDVLFWLQELPEHRVLFLEVHTTLV